MHPMSGYTATYCTKVLTLGTSTTASNTTTVLHVLTLLKELMPVFPKKELKVIVLNDNTVISLSVMLRFHSNSISSFMHFCVIFKC